MLRFIHAADLHFDRSFEGLKGLCEEAVRLLPERNRQMLDNLVAAAIAKEVDFVLLAGDTFHQAKPSLKAQGALMEALRRLEQAEIPVFMSFGNHDYYKAERYWFAFPENVRLFTKASVTSYDGVTSQGEGYRISGFSYETPHLEQGMVSAFPVRNGETYALGMYHGDPAAAVYAPFSLAEMKAKGYDYWALGHIHVPTVLSETPPILYPGTPQGHSRKETAGGFVEYVELTPGHCRHEAVPVAAVFWRELTVSAAHSDRKKLLAELAEQLLALGNEQALLVAVKLAHSQLDAQTTAAVKNGELQQYLNQLLWQDSEIQIASLELLDDIEAERGERPQLSAARTAQHLAVYQDQQIFGELLEELYRHPIAGELLQEYPAYQQDVLAAANNRLAADFALEEDEK